MTFRWPWVPRIALDVAEREIEFLREHCRQLTDQLTRIERFRSGMTETPRAERPKVDPMPPTVREYIEGFANASIRKEQRDALYRRHVHNGESWAQIIDSIELEPSKPPYPL